jgi:hypothetical protein
MHSNVHTFPFMLPIQMKSNDLFLDYFTSHLTLFFFHLVLLTKIRISKRIEIWIEMQITWHYYVMSDPLLLVVPHLIVNIRRQLIWIANRMGDSGRKFTILLTGGKLEFLFHDLLSFFLALLIACHHGKHFFGKLSLGIMPIYI